MRPQTKQLPSRCRLRTLLLLAAINPVLGVARPTCYLDFGANGQYISDALRSELREPPFAGTLYLNGSFNWPLSKDRLGLEMSTLFNTDDLSRPKKLNQLRLIPSWSWGRSYLGDFSTTFSRYTYDGVPLRGAGIELCPGNFRLAVVAGQSKWASDALNASYDRRLYALKIGTEAALPKSGARKSGLESFSVTVLKANDDTASHPADSTGRVPPQDNLAASVGARFRIARWWTAELEGAGSLFSHDTRSDKRDIGPLNIKLSHMDSILLYFPDWAFQPRVSSRASYAFRGSVRFDPNPRYLSPELSFAQVGPGYTSLGSSYLRNDYRSGKLDISTCAIPRTTLGVSGEIGDDHVGFDTLYRAVFHTIGGHLNIALTSRANLAACYSLSTKRNDNSSDTVFGVNSLTQVVSATPYFSLTTGRVAQSINLSGTYQEYRDRVRAQKTGPDKKLTIGINYLVTPLPQVTLSPGFEWTTSLLPGETFHPNASFTGDFALPAQLRNRLTLSVQRSSTGTNLSLTGTHSYSLTKEDVIRLNFNASGFFVSGKTDLRGTAGVCYNRRLKLF